MVRVDPFQPDVHDLTAHRHHGDGHLQLIRDGGSPGATGDRDGIARQRTAPATTTR